MVGCVVFDLDDTLYEEIDYCKSGFRAVARVVAGGAGPCEELYNALWSQFTAGNRGATFNAALEQVGIAYDDELIAELVKTYREHYPSITLPIDSEMVLKSLQTKYRLALLTDGYLPAQRLKVEALGIDKYFECIVYTEELGRQCWKPSAAGFEKIQKAFNAEGESCVYVADNPAKDFIAPNNLGFETIQITLPNNIHHGKAVGENAKAKHVIRYISELPMLLKEI
jgi:putative hydrolase of the HAD superfamily